MAKKRKSQTRTDPLTGMKYEKGSLMDMMGQSDKRIKRSVQKGFSIGKPSKSAFSIKPNKNAFSFSKPSSGGLSFPKISIPTNRRPGRQSALDKKLQAIASAAIVGIIALVLIGQWLKSHPVVMWVIIVALFLGVIGIAYYWFKKHNLTPEQRAEKEKQEEIETGIRIKRLRKKRAGELEGLTEKEQEYLINKWLEEGEEVDLTGKSRSGKPMFIEKPLSKHQAERIIRERGTRCQYPNCFVRITLDVHHILPRSQGGSNNDNNLIVLCPNHHRQQASIPKERLKYYATHHRNKGDDTMKEEF
ncbi:HNH endonuclease [Candidatus Woesearchaeota archaeon]|nr:HNH endonuclease [Candidatus Woesearchaeota archaeon]